MKKQIMNLAICGAVLFNAGITMAASNLKECMQNLPNVISFTHVQDKMMKNKDDFRDYESNPETKGLGYSQSYSNKVCWVTAFVYDLGLKSITAEDILTQREVSLKELNAMQQRSQDTVDQVYVTFIDDYFFKLNTTCAKLYSGQEERFNDMTARVVSSTVEEEVAASLNRCLKK